MRRPHPNLSAKPPRAATRSRNMTAPNAPATPPAPKPQLGVQLGPIVLRGWQAGLFLLAVLAVIVRAIIKNKPWIDPSPMWITAALWFWFEIYWTIKAKG